MNFCLNKAVKFNSGQYINNNLEGGPWAPILVEGYFTGAAVIREYTVISFQNNTQNAFQFLNDQDFLHLLHMDWDYGLEHGIQAKIWVLWNL